MKTFEQRFPVLLILLSIAGTLVFGQCPQDPAGDYSHAICISKTQFVFEFQDPINDPPMDCPPDTMCADISEICSATVDPVCINTVPGSENMCNECPPGTLTPSNVCVNDTAFAFCINSKVSQTMIYPCPAATPYCKIVPDVSTCTPIKKGLDCPLSIGGGDPTPDPTTDPPTNPPTDPPVFTCKQAGFFANTSDTTCKGYYKCQMNTSGGFDMFSYSCTQVGYAFYPVKKSCVLATSFKCSNA